MEKIIDDTLEYGQGYSDLTEKFKKTKKEEDFSIIYDSFNEYGKKILDYHIYKIKYSLNTKNTIQSLIIIYKNINDSQEKELFNTQSSHIENETLEEISFGEFEEIEDVYFYLSKEGHLEGICIMTNYKNKYIGNHDIDPFKDDHLQTKKNIVLSFGGNASKSFGLSSLFCHYISKRKLGIIRYLGLLELKSKIKNDKEFRAKIDLKKNSFNEKQKLILDICSLPDASFFPIANYIIAL